MPENTTVTGSMKLFASRFSVAIISLAFYSVAAYHVPTKAELAPIAAMAIIAELFRVARSMGIPSAMLRDVPEHVALSKHEEARALVQSTLVYTTLAGIVLAGAAWFCRSGLSEIGLFSNLSQTDLLIILAVSLLTGIYDTLQLALLSLQRFGRQSLAYFITMASQRVVAIVLLLRYGITGALAGFLIGAGLGVVVSLFWTRQYIFGAVRLMSFPRLLSYSAPYYLQGFTRYVFQEGDQLVLKLLFSDELLVTFFMAKRIVHGIRMMIDAITDALRPKIGELRTRGDEAVRAGFAKSSRFLSYAVLPVTLGVAAISRPLMLAYAGPQYADAGIILLVLSLAMTFYAYFSLYEVGIHMLGRPAQRLYVDLSCALVMLTGFLGLGPLLGGSGIALAELIGFGLSLIVGVRLLRSAMGVRFDRRALWRSLLASGVMGVVVGAASYWLAKIHFLPVLVVLGAAMFAMIFARLLDAPSLKEIREALPRSFGWLVSMLERIGGAKSNTDPHGDKP